MGKANIVSNESAIPWYEGEGNKREKVSVHRVIPSFDQGICTYVRITLCTLTFSLLFPSSLYQGMALLLLTTLPFPIVFTVCDVMTQAI